MRNRIDDGGTGGGPCFRPYHEIDDRLSPGASRKPSRKSGIPISPRHFPAGSAPAAGTAHESPRPLAWQETPPTERSRDPMTPVPRHRSSRPMQGRSRPSRSGRRPFLLRASHITSTTRTDRDFLVAMWALRGRTLLRSLDDRHPHPRKPSHNPRCPAVHVPILIAPRVIGAIQVQPLVVRARSIVDLPDRCRREYRPELRPVGPELGLDTPHQERVVPEVDEHPGAITSMIGRSTLGHFDPLVSPKKFRDARGVPGVVMIGPRCSLSGRWSDG